ncbi:hypothetical protein AWENTII_007623 [Aspergillus wentii]
MCNCRLAFRRAKKKPKLRLRTDNTASIQVSEAENGSPNAGGHKSYAALSRVSETGKSGFNMNTKKGRYDLITTAAAGLKIVALTWRAEPLHYTEPQGAIKGGLLSCYCV